jgi:hypothetical protein
MWLWRVLIKNTTKENQNNNNKWNATKYNVKSLKNIVSCLIQYMYIFLYPKYNDIDIRRCVLAATKQNKRKQM